MKNKKLILYIHGWNSYAGARKALLLQDMLKNNSDFEVASITLDSHPRHAINQLEKIIEKEIKTRKVNLIGSSLGGYYATFLSEKYDLKAAMINPAVSAYKIFKNDRKHWGNVVKCWGMLEHVINCYKMSVATGRAPFDLTSKY